MIYTIDRRHKINLRLDHGVYGNCRLALVLIEEDTGETWTKITVNESDIDLADDEIIVKNYDENDDGLLKFLVQEKIILGVTRCLPLGDILVPICRINIPVILKHCPNARIGR